MAASFRPLLRLLRHLSAREPAWRDLSDWKLLLMATEACRKSKEEKEGEGEAEAEDEGEETTLATGFRRVLEVRSS